MYIIGKINITPWHLRETGRRPSTHRVRIVARLGSHVDVDGLKVHGGRLGVLQAVGEGPV